MRLRLLGCDLVVARLPAAGDLPAAGGGRFFSATLAPGEISVVCEPAEVPEGAERIEPGWRALVVVGPLAFEMTGVLASVAAPLADAGISIFALSTFDTDYILVKAHDLDRAVASLVDAGHEVGPRE